MFNVPTVFIAKSFNNKALEPYDKVFTIFSWPIYYFFIQKLSGLFFKFVALLIKL